RVEGTGDGAAERVGLADDLAELVALEGAYGARAGVVRDPAGLVVVADRGGQPATGAVGGGAPAGAVLPVAVPLPGAVGPPGEPAGCVVPQPQRPARGAQHLDQLPVRVVAEPDQVDRRAVRPGAVRVQQPQRGDPGAGRGVDRLDRDPVAARV